MKSQKQFFQLMQLLTRGFGIQTPKDDVSLHHYIDLYWSILHFTNWTLSFRGELNVCVCIHISILFHTNIVYIAICMLGFLGNLGWTNPFPTHPPASSLLCPGVQASDLKANRSKWKALKVSVGCQNWKKKKEEFRNFYSLDGRYILINDIIIDGCVKKFFVTLSASELWCFFPKRVINTPKHFRKMTLPWCLEGCLRSCSLRKPAVMIPAGSAKSPMPPKQGTNKAAMDEETSKSHKISTFARMDSCKQQMKWIHSNSKLTTPNRRVTWWTEENLYKTEVQRKHWILGLGKFRRSKACVFRGNCRFGQLTTWPKNAVIEATTRPIGLSGYRSP